MKIKKQMLIDIIFFVISICNGTTKISYLRWVLIKSNIAAIKITNAMTINVTGCKDQTFVV
ncbi:MAG: hypothetical protein KAH01_02745 [Caldisericia bacterium]|nr:hypothetical protein [Caldisericia bacterium]